MPEICFKLIVWSGGVGSSVEETNWPYTHSKIIVKVGWGIHESSVNYSTFFYWKFRFKYIYKAW